MLEQLKIIKEKYLNLQKQMLENKQIFNNIDFLKKINKLEKIVFIYDEYLNLEKELKNTEILIQQNDKNESEQNDLLLLAEEIKKNLESQMEIKLEKLKTILFNQNQNDDRSVIMEIKGAVGGNESNLFVSDLFRAYTKYAESQNWKIDIINLNPSLKNGIISVEMIIYGENIFSFLKYESGIHRIQRVPETENKGRIHTSTARVLVLPYVEEQKLDLNWNDIRVDTFNASGPGGQSVNTTKSAVRLTYLPTGDSVACQIGKSQHQNKDKAFQLLKNKVFDKIISKKNEKQNKIKKDFIGTGARSEKIRTYNYAQNRVTDHRINLSLQKLDFFMEGKINLIIEPLIEELKKQELKEII
ncbi:protein chain release factor A [Candidatus Phytoplasma luffae]|uniref:Protein chain release factor A n=1 Tax=Loofah witches'-broom phytoplasma TaxID=35773 RepID=A0A975FIE3_LOWBP|nr:peptide chain release factor 1 [Candidatus Phytoplasma luffae]QTX02886.1 protein chain release factor A [Candidatus Phytoplasma luffae]QTX03015.1 protein chain release factor A [Candidatus Phytoplasma luffae]